MYNGKTKPEERCVRTKRRVTARRGPSDTGSRPELARGSRESLPTAASLREHQFPSTISCVHRLSPPSRLPSLRWGGPELLSIGTGLHSRVLPAGVKKNRVPSSSSYRRRRGAEPSRSDRGARLPGGLGLWSLREPLRRLVLFYQGKLCSMAGNFWQSSH